MLQVLLHSGADPNVQDIFGITPLIHAAARGRYNAVEMLLQAGARPLMVDSEGKTAIDYAESAQFPEIVYDLREAAQIEPRALLSPERASMSMSSPYDAGAPMTPRVPNQIEVKMTPRAPSGGLTPRRPAPISSEQSSPSKLPLSPSITKAQMSPLPRETLSALSKKLVHLSIMLEQDTVADDTRYPTFQMR